MTRKRATLGLPVFNERLRIRATLVQLHTKLSTSVPGYEWEILVVDDGSEDDSLDEIVAAAYDLQLPIRVVAHDRNHGLGSALSTIFRESHGDVIVTVDADLTYSVDHIARLVYALESSGAAVVVASPYAAGGSTRAVPRLLEMRSRVANRYLAAMTDSGVATFTGIVRAYDGEFARSLAPLRGGAEANIAVLDEAWRQRLEVVEIPALLNWTGQEIRRGRHSMISRKAMGESLHVLRQGVHLRVVTRRARLTRRSSPPTPTAPEPGSPSPAAGRLGDPGDGPISGAPGASRPPEPRAS